MSNKSIKISIGKGHFVSIVDKVAKNKSLSENEWDLIDNKISKIDLDSYTKNDGIVLGALISQKYDQVLNLLGRIDIPKTDIKRVLISLAI